MDIDPVLHDDSLVTSRMTHQPAESRFLLYHTISALRDDRASVYDDRATGAFDHGPVREGSAALARIGGVIRPLVDALRSGVFDSHGSSGCCVSCRARRQLLEYAMYVGGYARRIAMPPRPVAEGNCTT